MGKGKRLPYRTSQRCASAINRWQQGPGWSGPVLISVAGRGISLALLVDLPLVLSPPIVTRSLRSLALLVCLGSALGVSASRAWTGAEVDFPGDLQGWNLGLDSTKFTGPDGSPEWFRYQFVPGASATDYFFKMVTGNDWNKDFGGNLTFPKNAAATMFYQPAGDSAAKLSGGVTSGRRYVFTAKDPPLSNTTVSVMELSGTITTITSVSRNTSTGVVTVNLSQSPATEERVFIRYSTDNFATSSYIELSVAGTTATGFLGPLENGQAYKWYVLTTTASQSDLAAAPDLLALSWNNNSGSNYTITTPVETIAFNVNGGSGNYTTSKYFLDEIAGDEGSITVNFSINASFLTAVEVFTNLNRRDYANVDANSDGVPDGVRPPDGSTIPVGNDDHYYKAYTMTDTGGSNFSLTLPVNKTGAYRLSVRWKIQGDSNWRWYTNTGANRRDHAVVASPVQSRDIRMYEINIFNQEASGKTFATRSTIEDLSDRPGRLQTDPDRVNKFDLDYLEDLGVNWLWFQPYHPYGWEGRHLSAQNIRDRDPSQGSANTKVWNGSNDYYDDVNYPFALGSPYAVKNFWEIEPRMSAAFSGDPSDINATRNATNRAAAMAAFQNFMADADGAGVNLMPDAAFNHSAWDIELGQPGLDYIMPGAGASGWSAADLIHDREVRVFSRTADYAQRASFYTSFFNNNIAPAPDRGDFGKWLDAVDIFFGRYASLVNQNPADNDNRNSEADWFNYDGLTGNFDGVTRGVWQYFARYAVYWLEKGRAPGTNRNSTAGDGDAAARYAWDARGIDGLRCDFGQGLPPQAWEYIINTARSYKWSFVFMSESLDGGNITYRSNRHFDILNENIVFPGKAATTTSQYRTIFEDRRNAYGQGLVLLNTVSHDEDNYVDPWQAFVRYAVFGTIDGAPLIFPGQELGVSQLFGYDLYEINFGKPVPHFKTYNSMMTLWGNTDYALDQLSPAYSAVNAARAFSPALKSSNRFFLNQIGGGADESIFSVAKFESRNASPVTSDVVFGFVNLNRNAAENATFSLNVDADSNSVNDFGIKSGRKYNVRNIAAHLGQVPNRRDIWLWGGAGGGFTGANILANGVFVGLNSIPGSDPATWTNSPYEAQYLKLYDTTAPADVTGSVTSNITNGYIIGTSAAFNWNAVAVDSEGIVPKYNVEIAATSGPNTAIVETNSYTHMVGADTGVSVRVRAVNPYDTASGSAFTAWTTNAYILTPGGDFDNDGASNQQEHEAGGNPLVPKTVASVTLGDLLQVYNGSPRSASATTSPTNLTVAFTYNGSGTAPTEPGAYPVVGTINDIVYQGSATNTFVITGPVAGADSVTKSTNNTPFKIPLATLLSNDTRIDNSGASVSTGLSITAATSGPGNTAALSGAFVLFTPSANETETFTYTLTDGTSSREVTVTVSSAAPPAAPPFTLILTKTGVATYDGNLTTVTHDFIGVPNQTYTIQFTGELNQPWEANGDVPTGASGSFSVPFSQSGDRAADWNGSMFFRATQTAP